MMPIIIATIDKISAARLSNECFAESLRLVFTGGGFGKDVVAMLVPFICAQIDFTQNLLSRHFCVGAPLQGLDTLTIPIASQTNNHCKLKVRYVVYFSTNIRASIML